jgi:RNA polymerase sigma-70 factor (ECF subfamily)
VSADEGIGQSLGWELPAGGMTAIAGNVVLAARSGDATAFAALVHVETPAAYRLALSIVRSPAEAEDAVQEAFLRAWRDIHSLREADRWPAWFRRLVVRSALDQTRHRPRVREVDLDLAFNVPGLESSVHPADRLELMAAFDRLAPDDRAILALRFYQDLEIPDAAAALGIPLGTAKSRLHRAIGRLREQMRQEP